MLSFIVATWIVTIIPGPTMILIMLNSVQRGFAKGVQTSFGGVLADAIILTVTMSGLGTLLYSSQLAFTVVKWLGVGYLTYLGLRQLLSRLPEQPRKPADLGEGVVQAKGAGGGNAFLQGLGVTLLNPKIIGFFIAFFPQFIDRKKDILAQLLILAPVFLLNVLCLFLIFALFASSISPLIESRRGQRILHFGSGVSLLGCGLFAATMERIAV